MSDSGQKTSRLTTLYPEIAATGRLSRAITQIHAQFWESIDTKQESESPFWASFRKNDRSMRVTVSTDEHMYISDFWSRGIEMATLNSATLQQVADACKLWLVDSLTLQSMKLEIPDFQPTEMGYEFEAGAGIKAQWEYLLSSRAMAKSTLEPLAPLVREAAKQRLLRQLFPYQSMTSLHFSRTAGYPYTNDCPWAEAIGTGRWDEPENYRRYRALKPDGTIIGEGTAREVIHLVVKFLPRDIGPAKGEKSDDFDPSAPVQ